MTPTTVRPVVKVQRNAADATPAGPAPAPHRSAGARTLRVKDLMTQPPQLCTVDTTLALASQRMSSTGAGTMIVLNRHGRIGGILTDRDLALAVGTLEGAVATATVGSVMTCGAHVCAPDDEVREAVARMARAKVRRLPVVAPDGDVKGLISIDDVLLWGLGTGGVTPRDVLAALRAICAAHRPVE